MASQQSHQLCWPPRTWIRASSCQSAFIGCLVPANDIASARRASEKTPIDRTAPCGPSSPDSTDSSIEVTQVKARVCVCVCVCVCVRTTYRDITCRRPRCCISRYGRCNRKCLVSCVRRPLGSTLSGRHSLTAGWRVWINFVLCACRCRLLLLVRQI